MSNKLNIEQLINAKLGDAELKPSADSWSKIRRKYRRADFLRFNSGKLNIFYVAGLVVVGAALSIVLFSSPEDSLSEEQISTEQEPTESITNKQPLEKVYTKRDPAPETSDEQKTFA